MESSYIGTRFGRTSWTKQAGHGPVTLWGTGSPKREFLHVDDLADAALYLMKNYSGPDIVNVGTGQDLPIRELAGKIQAIVGHKGPVTWDSSKPDGTPRKLLDVSRLEKLGWKARIPLEEGLQSTYKWFVEHHDEARVEVKV